MGVERMIETHQYAKIAKGLGIDHEGLGKKEYGLEGEIERWMSKMRNVVL